MNIVKKNSFTPQLKYPSPATEAQSSHSVLGQIRAFSGPGGRRYSWSQAGPACSTLQATRDRATITTLSSLDQAQTVNITHSAATRDILPEMISEKSEASASSEENGETLNLSLAHEVNSIHMMKYW